MSNDVEITIKSKDKSKGGFDSASDNASGLQRKLQLLSEGGFKPLAVAAAAFGPAAIPALAAATGAVLSLGVALAGAGAAGGVYGAVFGSAFKEVKKDEAGFNKLRDSIDKGKADMLGMAKGSDEYNAAAKKVSETQTRLNGEIAGLDPLQRKAVDAYENVTTAWQGFVDANKPAVYSQMAQGSGILAQAIPKLQPLFDVARVAVGKLLDTFGRFVSGGNMDKVVRFLADQAGPAFDAFGKIIGNFGAGFGNMFGHFAGTSSGLLGWLVKLSVSFRNWSTGGGFEKFMDYANSNGPNVVGVLSKLADSAANIYKVMKPLAPVSLALAGALAAIIAALPVGVLTVIVGLWLSYSIAMKGYNTYMLLSVKAAKAMELAQGALNLVMDANPILLVVVAIAALAAGLIYAYQHSQTFRNVVQEAFAAVGKAVLSQVKLMLTVVKGLADGILDAVIGILSALGKIPGNSWASRAANDVRGFRNTMDGQFDGAMNKIDAFNKKLDSIPKVIKLKGDIADLQSKAASAIASLNRIPKSRQATVRANIAQLQQAAATARATIARIQGKTVTINLLYKQSAQPGTAGNGLGVLKASGGITGAANGATSSGMTWVGEHGPELLQLPPSTRVRSNPDSTRMTGAGGGSTEVVLRIDTAGSALDKTLVEILRKAIRVQGGNVQVVLGA